MQATAGFAPLAAAMLNELTESETEDVLRLLGRAVETASSDVATPGARRAEVQGAQSIRIPSFSATVMKKSTLGVALPAMFYEDLGGGLTRSSWQARALRFQTAAPRLRFPKDREIRPRRR